MPNHMVKDVLVLNYFQVGEMTPLYATSGRTK